MKKSIILILSIYVLLGCEDLDTRNIDPDIVTNPPVESVFSFAEKRLGDYKGSEWFYDNHQIMEWLQYVVGDDGNANDINTLEPRGGKYSVF